MELWPRSSHNRKVRSSKDAGHLLEWQSLKWRGQGEDNTEQTGIYYKQKKTEMGWAHVADGQ